MVIIFCGVPGTGKTTTARGLAASLQKLGRVQLLTSDEISGGSVYRRIFKLIKDNLDRADYILVDATFYKKEWRETVKAIAGEKNVRVYYLHCPLKTCLERNKEREPCLPERAIHIIDKEMERPENPDVSINTETIEVEQAVSEILNQLNSSPRNKGRYRDGY